MARRNKTTEEFIKEAKVIHGAKYDYSKVNYINNSTKNTHNLSNTRRVSATAA